MKKINIYFAAGLFTLGVVTSCKKIDNIHPHDSIDVSESFKTVGDAQSWDVGFYANFRGVQYGEYMYNTDVQADQLNASASYGNNDGSVHRWGQFFLSSDYALSDEWGAYYHNIANINVALAGFKNITTTNSADAAKLSQYTGDLYLGRAYYYFELISRWAKSYTPATAASDPGVPLVLVYDINAEPARASVKDVYTQILSDLKSAEDLLANVSGKQGAATFTIDAAVALEARIKLNMQDWAGAYTAANKLITAGTYPLITSAAALADYWDNDGTQESILQLFVSNPKELPNNGQGTYYLNYQSGTKAYNPFYIPSQWVVDMYDDADIRKGVYFSNLPVNINGVTGTAYLVNKFPGNPTFNTGAVSSYYNEPKVLRIGEIYLIAAEAAANNSNTGGALTALNALRTARGLTALSGISGTTLTTAIQDERFRELAFEGFRLDDLKRWHLGFTRKDPQNLDLITTGATFNTLNISADDNKFVWGIPTNDITINRNLVQNPGW